MNSGNINAMEIAHYVKVIDILLGGHLHRGYREAWELLGERLGSGGVGHDHLLKRRRNLDGQAQVLIQVFLESGQLERVTNPHELFDLRVAVG